MNQTNAPTSTTSFATLHRFARLRAAQERCELCGADLPSDHPHLMDLGPRQLLCVCPSCVILLGGKYRQVPQTVEFWSDFRMDDVQWQSLNIPIDLAFFFHHSAAGRIVALYPSPAGAIESPPPVDAWEELLAKNPRLGELQADVEALLVNRVHGAREVYRAPIDECYRLSGLIRMHWRGISGGTEVWKQVEEFFAGLKKRAASAGGALHA